MNKMDIARGPSMDSRQTREVTEGLTEEESLEMRLELLSQQEMQKLKNNAELLKTLRGLHTLIKESTANVQRAAHEVRAYPVEAVTQATVRIEQSVKACEKSAARAQEVYTEAARLVSKLEGSYIMWIVMASLLSAMAVATPVMLILR